MGKKNTILIPLGKLKRVLLIALLIGFACEDKEQDTIPPDTTPPTVSIQSPITNNPIFEIVTIVVETNDNVGISKVEFYVDDSLVSTDTESPYEYDWNTTEYEDGSEHIVKVISYDNSDNSTTSQPIVYVIDNSTSRPTPSGLYPITYNDGFQISWSQNNDDDFGFYKLYESLSEDMSNQTLVYETTERVDTNYVVTGVSENEIRYYQLVVGDVWGLHTESEVVSFGYVIDIDGNIYKIVQIGNQIWMAENLKVTHYNDGSEIPTGYSNSEWADLDGTETGAYAVYNDDPSNTDVYGNLYNWYVVEDERGVCPAGWNVPTDDEIKELEMYLGMSQVEADDADWRGTNEGSKLAGMADLWNDGNLVNNPEFGTSGLNLLPGGYRNGNGNYYGMGYNGYFWSSTEGNDYLAWYRLLDYVNSEVSRYLNNKRGGFSVRCIRD
jgi:uncharacterized protein (TIGR02145 family)